LCSNREITTIITTAPEMTPKEMRDDEAQTHSKETKIQVVRKEMTNPKYNEIEKLVFVQSKEKERHNL
jgi:hypothetical protein